MRQRYMIVIEYGGSGENLSAYTPDVPGCVAVGDTRDEVIHNMADALHVHFKGLHEDNDTIPLPTTRPEDVASALRPGDEVVTVEVDVPGAVSLV